MSLSPNKKSVQVSMELDTIDKAKLCANALGLSMSTFVGVCVNVIVNSNAVAEAFRAAAFEAGADTQLINLYCERTGLEDCPHSDIVL